MRVQCCCQQWRWREPTFCTNSGPIWLKTWQTVGSSEDKPVNIFIWRVIILFRNDESTSVLLLTGTHGVKEGDSGLTKRHLLEKDFYEADCKRKNVKILVDWIFSKLKVLELFQGRNLMKYPTSWRYRKLNYLRTRIASTMIQTSIRWGFRWEVKSDASVWYPDIIIRLLISHLTTERARNSWKMWRNSIPTSWCWAGVRAATVTWPCYWGGRDSSPTWCSAMISRSSRETQGQDRTPFKWKLLKK